MASSVLPFFVSKPVFFLNLSCVNFIIGIAIEGDVAVLVVVCVFELCPSPFSSSVLLKSLVSSISLVTSFLFRDLVVSSSRLCDEAKHFCVVSTESFFRALL